MGLLTLTCLLAVLSQTVSSQTFESRCLSFQPQRQVNNATLTVLEYVPANTTLQFPDNDPSCNRASQAVSTDLCRVAMSIPTSNRSSITFEAWLPEDWTGRFLATGNGGVDGCVKYEDVAYGAANGFATVGTNNGHNGTSGEDFFQNDEIIRDFAFRAVHTSVVVGKKLAEAFYEQSHSKSYYLGCSLGGRQGLKAAEDSPEDFDGIVAGAPATDFNFLVAARARYLALAGPANSSNFIPASAWRGSINDEVLRQCDLIDGAADRIIEDPTVCDFDPTPLLCGDNADTSTCLTAEQVDIVRSVLTPLVADDDNFLYPALVPSGLAGAADRLLSGEPFPASYDWYRYVVYDPSWDPLSWTIADALRAEELNPSNIKTFFSELTEFEQRGGKILSYHGGNDQQITIAQSIRQYVRLYQSTESNIDSFFRLFQISGMAHCNSGPGAWVLGQLGGASSVGIPFEPAQNVLAAIVEWVEQGVAPDIVLGTKFVNDTVSQGIDFQRRHCRYPGVNVFVGGDDPRDIDSWGCQSGN